MVTKGSLRLLFGEGVAGVKGRGPHRGASSGLCARGRHGHASGGESDPLGLSFPGRSASGCGAGRWEAGSQRAWKAEHGPSRWASGSPTLRQQAEGARGPGPGGAPLPGPGGPAQGAGA